MSVEIQCVWPHSLYNLYFFSNNPLASGLLSVAYTDLWFRESLSLVICSWWHFSWIWSGRKGECTWVGNPVLDWPNDWDQVWLPSLIYSPLGGQERSQHVGPYRCPFSGSWMVVHISNQYPHSYVKKEPHSAKEFLS